ncbi:unnamed protein product [Sphagnum jensenii]|uniref:Uncharacterized protein n=1 Tax=Sphagnum jensenii TaxID=128206 RepID=A0ABP0W3S0_9BRYO
MEESRIRELVLDAIANVTVATCTTGRLQTPLDFVTITKVGIGMVAIMGSVYALYWNLRWICIATTDRPPIQQDADQLNAPDLEMGGRPLGHGENNNVSNNDIGTVAGASSATSPVLQEVLASVVQALEIASQLTISG